MHKNLVYFAIVAASLGVLALIFFTFFKIEESTAYFPPSREVQANEYLALDRLLELKGHPVRLTSIAGINSLSRATESIFVLQSDLIDWNEEITAFLDSWIYDGGALILCLMEYRTWKKDSALGYFLESFLIETGEQQIGTTNIYDSGLPAFGRNLNFKEPEDENLFYLKDRRGFIKLIQIPYGKGLLTVTANPRFMTSENIRYEENARLCWYLFGGEGTLGDAPGDVSGNPGVFFVRGRAQSAGLVNRLFDQGNFVVIIISGFALIIFGLWSVIPLFGIIKKQEEAPGKSLAGRFLAESRFFKRFNALSIYKETYIREIKKKIKKRNIEDETINQKIEEAQYNKNFFESLVTLKSILEQL